MRKFVPAFVLAFGLLQVPAMAEEVNLYSYRQEALINPRLAVLVRSHQQILLRGTCQFFQVVFRTKGERP